MAKPALSDKWDSRLPLLPILMMATFQNLLSRTKDMKNILGELLLNNSWCLKTMDGLQSSSLVFTRITVRPRQKSSGGLFRELENVSAGREIQIRLVQAFIFQMGKLKPWVPSMASDYQGLLNYTSLHQTADPL